MNQSTPLSCKHWQLIDHHGILELQLSLKDKSQNVLSSEVIEELNSALDVVIDANPQGLIISSGKENGFIVGADIAEFQHIENESQALEKVKFANAVLNRIEDLKQPTVAMINGHCFGGGFELALACDYRVISDSSDLRIGLPEIKLGIHPGFGGTVRLPELIGIPNAMDLILSGRMTSAFSAKKMGIAEYLVPPRQLLETAKYVVQKLPVKKHNSLLNKVFNLGISRHLISKYLTKQIASKANPNHYPAPYAVIENWKNHGGNRDTLLQQEQQSIANLLITTTSKRLVEVFFLQESLKQIGKQHDVTKVNSVHVVGAGVMGGDIAAWCALKGLQVTIHDRSEEALSKSKKRAAKLFKYKLKNNRLVERALDRFHPDVPGNGAKHADVIIEAIFEDLDVKRDVFKNLEMLAKPNCILASNTSSIPLESIAEALDDPTRLVGIHFFNPVAKMQLIEVVVGKQTAKSSKASASAFATQISRLPIPVKSRPGFLVNRVLMPYAMEAVELIKEGVSITAIDSAATKFGMPMGPVTLADTVGLDICLHVAENLSENFGGEVPQLIHDKVKSGELGKKSGQGFYLWKDGKPQKDKDNSDYPSEKIVSRLIGRYLNECVACLDDKIVTDPKLLDAALIFGTGFAPFRGGPMRYIEMKGAQKLLDTQTSLFKEFGERFKPKKGWKKLL